MDLLTKHAIKVSQTHKKGKNLLQSQDNGENGLEFQSDINCPIVTVSITDCMSTK